MISVIVPTVDGREEWLRRCKTAYAQYTTDYELIVIPNQPTCGLAWQLGAAKATGDYIHYSADDLEPHDGWWQAAIEVCDRGYLPAPRILNSDGSLQSCGEWETEAETGTQADFTRIPFMTRKQFDAIGPSLPIHYFTDNWISDRGRIAGFETGIHTGYLFTHHLANEQRGAGTTWNERMRHDHMLYQHYVNGDLAP